MEDPAGPSSRKARKRLRRMSSSSEEEETNPPPPPTPGFPEPEPDPDLVPGAIYSEDDVERAIAASLLSAEEEELRRIAEAQKQTALFVEDFVGSDSEDEIMQQVIQASLASLRSEVEERRSQRPPSPVRSPSPMDSEDDIPLAKRKGKMKAKARPTAPGQGGGAGPSGRRPPSPPTGGSGAGPAPPGDDLISSIQQTVDVVRPATRSDIELTCQWLISHPRQPEEIVQTRARILAEFRQRVGPDANATTVTSNDLVFLMNLYDQYVFASLLKTMRAPVSSICYNNTCTSVAGRYYPTSARIELSRKAFQPIVSGDEYVANGVTCSKWDECMLIVFEHELGHALIHSQCDEELLPDRARFRRGPVGVNSQALRWGTNISHPPAFTLLLHALFRHTSYKHDLHRNKTRADTARRELKGGDRFMTTKYIVFTNTLSGRRRKTVKVPTAVEVQYEKENNEHFAQGTLVGAPQQTIVFVHYSDVQIHGS